MVKIIIMSMIFNIRTNSLYTYSTYMYRPRLLEYFTYKFLYNSRNLSTSTCILALAYSILYSI